MQINSVPNKFEIYQEYYYVTNGEEISYAEALRLFAQMDADEKADFEQYYKDELEYKDCKNPEELRDKIDKYIYYYNNKRYQWGLNKMKPFEFKNFLIKTY